MEREHAPDRTERDPGAQPPRQQSGIVPLLVLQRSAGNRAVAGLLQRQTAPWNVPALGTPVRSERSRGLMQGRPPVIPTSGTPTLDPDAPGRLALGGYTAIAQWVASRNNANPLHRELVEHYVHGEGAPFRLTRAQMHQVLHSGSDHLNILGTTRWAEVMRAQEALRPVARTAPTGMASMPVRSTAVVACDDDLPSLGGFTCHIEGTLTGTLGSRLPSSEAAAIDLRANLWSRLYEGRPPPGLEVNPVDENAVYFRFAGTMNWEDTWDFDPNVPDPHGSPQMRSEGAERDTRLAHHFLPGDPFPITSETVPVTQAPETHGAVF